MMINIVQNVNEIRVGKIFYMVLAFLGEKDNDYIEKVTIIKDPYVVELGTKTIKHDVLFFDADYMSDYHNERINTSYATTDANIPVNNYNMHCMFKDRESAEKYIELINNNDIDALYKLGVLTKEKYKNMYRIENNKNDVEYWLSDDNETDDEKWII